MNVLLIEDELQAARRLEMLLKELDSQIRVTAHMDSVKSSVKWLRSHSAPDLIFMDIQLGDGLSFEIFEMTEVNAPIIFTTAYDEYALKAFKVNSIDYILKPVDKDELQSALKKFGNISRTNNRELLRNIDQVVQMLARRYKERFVIKVGERLHTVEVKDILYFYSQDKATFCHSSAGRDYILDFTLDQLAEMLDLSKFFRINRKYFISSSSIIDIIHYTNSRLKLVLKGSQDTGVIVARERVQEFKQWLDR